MKQVTFDRFFHPWHSISPGDDAPNQVNGIIEIQQGSKAKYELDKKTGCLRLDRILSSHLCYPFHYGFIPQTYCQDSDPLDILILCAEQLTPMSIVQATVLGVIKMVDGGEQDDKIIAIASNDPLMKHITNLDELCQTVVQSIVYFFQEYKKPEGKVVVIESVESREVARKIIMQAIDLYAHTFGPLK